jgi:signal transduction histidine kinase
MLSWTNTVIPNADSDAKYIVSIGIDVTDRKRAEEMHLILEKEKALNELKYRFFSMVSHQFRTPLSTILVTAQLLGSSPDKWTEEKKIKNIFRIESAAKNLTQLLVDILTINRAESGNIEFNPTKLNLQHFCQELIAEMPTHAQPIHTISFSNQGQCKNAYLDQKTLHSILKNLLLNGIKYSPQGGKIHLALSCENEETTFQVSDQGIGIPVSDQPQIFEAFYRGKNVGNISGTGLGLTVVKKCVDLHGGQITVKSEVGVGTTFTVTIKNYQNSSKPE